MSNTDVVKFASQFGNVLAYDNNKTPPDGFVINYKLSVDSPNGLQLTTYYNSQTKQIAVAIAGTNDFKDVAGYPSLYLGYGYNKSQIDLALDYFKEIQSFANSEKATVLTSGHSFAGLFVDIGSASYGFQGVKFDGVGGNAVINDSAYQAQLKSIGVSPPGDGNVVSVGVNGFFGQLFGGGLVEYFGKDISNTTYCSVNTDRGEATGVLNLLNTFTLGLPGYLATKIASAVYDHNSDSIDAAMQAGHFSCAWSSSPNPTSASPTISNIANLLNTDRQLDSLHDQGVLGNEVWNDYIGWSGLPHSNIITASAQGSAYASHHPKPLFSASVAGWI